MANTSCEDSLIAVLALHQAAWTPDRGTSGDSLRCTHDGQLWPCATVVAIDG